MNNNSCSAVPQQSSPRLRKPQRDQVEMVFACIDDLVSKNHQVRTVWAFVAKMDLSAFCEPIKARDGVAGRDAADPAMLVSVWLYANICGIGSGRALAKACLERDPFKWLCGGVGLNHHLLSDFRVQHMEALNALFTNVIALLVEKGLVKVKRVSQDGVRLRASAGASSFRRESTLETLLEDSKNQVEALERLVDDPEHAVAVGAAKAAAKLRAAKDRKKRLQQAADQLPELKKKQEAAAKKAGNGKRGQQILAKEPRVSTTDPEVRVMKMSNGGFNPAVNVQIATDTDSRAILAVEVSSEGSDSANLSQPLREQVEQRTGQSVGEHLLDGGCLKLDDIEQAWQEGVSLFIPPKPARTPGTRGKELEPKNGDGPGIPDWKQRMKSEEGKEIYKQRASTSETVNADLRTFRGLHQLTVRGLQKITCTVLWSALSCNLMHLGQQLLS